MNYFYHLIFFGFFSFFGFSQTEEETAISLYQQNKKQEAKEIFSTIYKKNTKNYLAIEYLGDIAFQQQKWDDAIGYFKILIQNFPKNANYNYKFGGAFGMKAKNVNKFKALGMIETIQNAFEKAAALDANHIDSRWALVHFYLEIPAIIGGSEKKAQKSANELLKISPVDGYLAKGHIDEYFKRYENAVLNYEKAHEIGKSKTTYSKLYQLILNKIKDSSRAKKIKS
jgi:tetratricopeptide (TPR) repeat protein